MRFLLPLMFSLSLLSTFSANAADPFAGLSRDDVSPHTITAEQQFSIEEEDGVREVSSELYEQWSSKSMLDLTAPADVKMDMQVFKPTDSERADLHTLRVSKQLLKDIKRPMPKILINSMATHIEVPETGDDIEIGVSIVQQIVRAAEKVLKDRDLQNICDALEVLGQQHRAPIVSALQNIFHRETLNITMDDFAEKPDLAEFSAAPTIDISTTSIRITMNLGLSVVAEDLGPKALIGVRWVAEFDLENGCFKPAEIKAKTVPVKLLTDVDLGIRFSFIPPKKSLALETKRSDDRQELFIGQATEDLLNSAKLTLVSPAIPKMPISSLEELTKALSSEQLAHAQRLLNALEGFAQAQRTKPILDIYYSNCGMRMLRIDQVTIQIAKDKVTLTETYQIQSIRSREILQKFQHKANLDRSMNPTSDKWTNI